MTTKVNIDVDTNKIYDDAVSPVAHPTAQTLGLLPRAIRAALAPIEKWILKQEHSIRQTEWLVQQKVEPISPDKIITPAPYVAVPALQALSYLMDNEHLRNLYASLLASAMNSDTQEYVHPAFVDIIKQFSPADAQFFRYIAENIQIPICKVRIQDKVFSDSIIETINNMTVPSDKDSGEPFLVESKCPLSESTYAGIDVSSHFVDIHIPNLSTSDILQSIVNLSRLGLICTTYDSVLPKRFYEPFLSFPEIQNLLKQHPKTSFREPVVSEGICKITLLGQNFAKVCL